MIQIEQLPDRFRISYFGKTGKVNFKDIAIPQSEKYKWEYCSNNERRDSFFKSWDGKPVKRAKSYFLNKFRTEEFLASLGEDVTKEIYEFNQPEIWFADIEVEVKEEFPDPAIAATPVLAVALVNSEGDVFVLGTKVLSSEQILSIQAKLTKYFSKFKSQVLFQYIHFESETELLYTLFKDWFKKIPLLTGWNFVGFDWKFLINRCKRLGVDYTMCSVNGNCYGEDCFPQHKVVVDYMELYKKWDRVIKIKENNKLETVAQQAVGLSKIKYNGTFMDLFHTDIETYIYYNAVDTFLVYLIDKKINTMQTFLMLGNVTKVETMKAFSPIWMTESVMAREFFSRKLVVTDIVKGKKFAAFEGAYVKKPVPGLYEHLATFDFASLYPSTMRQFNISPETYKGKLIEADPEKNWIKTASGAVFDNSEDSVIRTILTEFYGKRKAAKNTAFEIEKEIDFLKKVLKTK